MRASPKTTPSTRATRRRTPARWKEPRTTPTRSIVGFSTLIQVTAGPTVSMSSTSSAPQDCRAPGRVGQLPHLGAVEGLEVGLHAAEEAAGEDLAVVRVAEALLVVRVRDEGDLREDRGHVRPDEDVEGGGVDSPVADLVLLPDARDHALLDRGGEVPALVDLAVGGDRLDEVLEVLERGRGDRVLSRGHLLGVGGAREVQEVGLDAAGPRVAARVRVDGEEEVGAARVRDRRALVEGDEDVGRAGEDDLRPQLLHHEAVEPPGHVEDELLLLQPAAADRPGVVAAVAGVDHDAPGAEAEL